MVGFIQIELKFGWMLSEDNRLSRVFESSIAATPLRKFIGRVNEVPGCRNAL